MAASDDAQEDYRHIAHTQYTDVSLAELREEHAVSTSEKKALADTMMRLGTLRYRKRMGQ